MSEYKMKKHVETVDGVTVTTYRSDCCACDWCRSEDLHGIERLEARLDQLEKVWRRINAADERLVILERQIMLINSERLDRLQNKGHAFP